MQYPNKLQSALLFDGTVADLEAMVRTFARVEEARSGARFNMPEVKPGVFYRLFGGGELMITFEYVANPANPDVFRGALQSPVTGLLCPDVRQRITRNRSLIIVEVSHGVLSGMENEPRFAAIADLLPREGASLGQFRRRLEVLGLICRIVADHAPPSLVHWTQSDQLIPGEKFEMYASGDTPSPLHVHPYLFGPSATGDGQRPVGIRTFGAAHFIGREVVVEPSILPWSANYEVILAFMRVALVDNGYIVPHNDTFGPEDRSLSYRVLHREADRDLDQPFYELAPLLHREHGFAAPEHVPLENVIDDRSPPPELMPADDEDKMELANEWREKRKLAEGIGGRFEVRSISAPPPRPAAPAGPPSISGAGLRARIFGRKGL